MNTVSLNNLWNYLQGLSLTQANRRWLADKLTEASSHRTVTSEESRKLKKLDALFGVWADNPDGERIEQAIKEAREADYERKLIPLEE